MKEYNIQTIPVKPGDVLLVQINDDIDLDYAQSIHRTVQEMFPNNDILMANRRILDSLTILRPEDWLLHKTELSCMELLKPDWEIKL